MQAGAQLRQLGVGDIVDRVFTLYRQRPLGLIALASVPYLAFILAIGVLVLVFGRELSGFAPFLDAVNNPGAITPHMTTALANAFAALIGFGLVAVVVAIVTFSAQSASLIDALASQYLGRPTTVGASFNAGMRAAPRLIIAGLLVFLSFVGLWLVLALAFVLLQIGLVVAVGVIAGAVATVYLFASWLVVPVVATVEGVGPVQALRRAWTLSNGNRWRVLGLQILLSILQVVLSGLISFVVLLALATSDQILRFAVNQLASFVSTILWIPVEWGAFTLLYFDLRVRKEGFDLQLAAEALPREV